MTAPSTLGQQLRDARVAAGLSLRESSRRLTLAPSYLSDVEHDRRVPSEAVLRRMADMLALDADALLATAGRFGAAAEEYLRTHPTAVALLRSLAERGVTEEQLRNIAETLFPSATPTALKG